MPRSADRSMLRLEIRAGEIAVCDTRLVRIEACLNDGVARVRDLATGEINAVAISALRARASIAHGPQIDAHLEAARSSKAVPWQRAANREQALGALFDGSGAWGERAQQIANAQDDFFGSRRHEGWVGVVGRPSASVAFPLPHSLLGGTA